jgi:hypothetical protein
MISVHRTIAHGAPIALAAALLAPAPAQAEGPSPPPPRARVAEIGAASAALEVSLRTARAARDVERAACLDDLLTQSHVALRQALRLRDALDDAQKAGQATLAEHEAVRLAYLAERAARLARASARCGAAGALAVPPGTTQVRVHVPRLPDPLVESKGR